MWAIWLWPMDGINRGEPVVAGLGRERHSASRGTPMVGSQLNMVITVRWVTSSGLNGLRHEGAVPAGRRQCRRDRVGGRVRGWVTGDHPCLWIDPSHRLVGQAQGAWCRDVDCRVGRNGASLIEHWYRRGTWQCIDVNGDGSHGLGLLAGDTNKSLPMARDQISRAADISLRVGTP